MDAKENKNEELKLSDFLRLEDLANVKFRFVLMIERECANSKTEEEWDMTKFFGSANEDQLLDAAYWNYNSKKSFKLGETVFAFARVSKIDDTWILYHVGKVTEDLNVYNGVGYKWEDAPEYAAYCNRLIIKFHNDSQTMVRNASSVIDKCTVHQLLPDTFAHATNLFPGYDKVNISWRELKTALGKESWKTALQNQKAVYLITDKATGKHYVGSATGEGKSANEKKMLYGRWEDYIANGTGGNKGLEALKKEKGFEYIQDNFVYSILEIFKSTTDSQLVLERESWWKNVLLTREHGYNEN